MKQAYRHLLEWLSERLKEPTTWHGLNILTTAIGVTIKPEIMNAILTLGSAFSGLILILTKEETR